jgi:MoaA/NifB/PqqE/SkfB family radical SAM enzyme
MKKYCVLPFISVRIEDDKNLNSTKVRPCCFYQDKDMPIFKNVNEYLDSEFLKKLQQHFLTQNELPSGCNICQETESKKLLSVRQLKNKFFHDITLNKSDIRELDIFPSNTCNLSCVMCSPKFSSSLAVEYKKLGLIDTIYNFDETELVVETIKSLPNLQHIHIAGGEFFYGKHCLKILDAIKIAGIPNVEFITNGTVCNDNHISILKEFNNLSLRFSIDGTDNYYDFIRHPADWQQVRDNILKFKEQIPNAHLETAMTVQPLNIFNILDWTADMNVLGIETHWQIVSGHLGWQAITPNEKQLASDFILNNYRKFSLESKQTVTLLNYARNVIPNLKFNTKSRDQFVDRLVQLCKSRKISPQTVNQLLGPWTQLQETINSKLL